MQTRSPLTGFRRLMAGVCAGGVHMFAFRVLDASIGGPSRSGTNDESLRERADVGELCHDSAKGTPLMVQYGNGLAAPLAWIDVAGHCSGRCRRNVAQRPDQATIDRAGRQIRTKRARSHAGPS